MEALVKILIGLLLLAASLSYLYRPAIVLKINDLARGVLFNDAYVLHYRRRWGVPIFVAAVVFLYSGLANLRSNVERARSSYGEMDDAYRAFYARRYDEAERLCRSLLARHPNDPHAGFLLRQTVQSKRSSMETAAPGVDHP